MIGSASKNRDLSRGHSNFKKYIDLPHLTFKGTQIFQVLITCHLTVENGGGSSKNKPTRWSFQKEMSASMIYLGGVIGLLKKSTSNCLGEYKPALFIFFLNRENQLGLVSGFTIVAQPGPKLGYKGLHIKSSKGLELKT